jgi:lysophospholipase L1-like esterase
VQAVAAAHQLPGVLVVALGTNGTVTADEVDEMVHAAIGAHHIVFVTIDVPRSWEVGDNAVLLAAPARYPGLVTVADWHAVAAAHPEWFTPDQVHLQTPGAQALAALILSAVT